MALQRLLELVGSHHLTWVEDFGIVLMIAVSVYAVLWCMKDTSEWRCARASEIQRSSPASWLRAPSLTCEGVPQNPC